MAEKNYMANLLIMGALMKLPTEAIAGVADLKAGYTLGHADVAILKALAAELLAVREAQRVPVAWTSEANLELVSAKIPGNLEFMSGDKSVYKKPIPLYTAPPAPAVICCDVMGSSLSIGWSLPDGYKLVPVELLSTASMLIDLCRTHATLNGGGTYNQRVLSDCETTMNAIANLLAAAPTPTK
jgi:hypothetical protein